MKYPASSSGNIIYRLVKTRNDQNKKRMKIICFILIITLLSSSATGGAIVPVLDEKDQTASQRHRNPRSSYTATRKKVVNPRQLSSSDDKEEGDDDDDDDKEERYIVKCKGKEDDCLQQLISTGHPVQVVHQLKGTEFFAIKIKKSQTQEIQWLSEIDELEEDPIRVPFTIRKQENDPKKQKQSGPEQQPNNLTLYNKQQQKRRQLLGNQITPYGIDLIKAREVWAAYGITGTNVKVCVIDTGLESHKDLNFNPNRNISGWVNEFELDWDKDTFGHGTHVTGIIGATDNDIGVVGVAPDVNIFVARVFDDDGDWYASDIEAAAQACYDGGAHIINMSLGGTRRSNSEEAFFQSLYTKGVLSIAAAGNEAQEDGNPVKYPASYDKVISVGSVGATKVIDVSSSHNKHVDLVAPGVFVESLDNNGRGLVRHSGTSMACPHVVGVAALLKSYNMSLTPREITKALERSAEDLGPEGKDNRYGRGLVDAMAAMKRVSGGPTTTSLSSNCIVFKVTVNTDNYGYESSWELRRMDGSLAYVGASFPNNRKNVNEYCIPEDCYKFQMNDAYGDGIDNGSYKVKYDGETVLQDDGDFEYHGKTKKFGDCLGR